MVTGLLLNQEEIEMESRSEAPLFEGFQKTEDQLALEKLGITHEEVADMIDVPYEELGERAAAASGAGIHLSDKEWVQIIKALRRRSARLYEYARVYFEENHVISVDAMAEAFA